MCNAFGKKSAIDITNKFKLDFYCLNSLGSVSRLFCSLRLKHKLETFGKNYTEMKILLHFLTTISIAFKLWCC